MKHLENQIEKIEDIKEENTPIFQKIQILSIEKGTVSYITPEEDEKMKKDRVYHAWGGDPAKWLVKIYDLDKNKLVGIVRYLMEYPRVSRGWIWFVVIGFILLVIIFVIIKVGSKDPIQVPLQQKTWSIVNTWYIDLQDTPRVKAIQGTWPTILVDQNNRLAQEIEQYKNTLQLERLKTLNASQLTDLTDKDNEIWDLTDEREKLKKELQICQKSVADNTVDPMTAIQLDIGKKIIEKCKNNELDKDKCAELVYFTFK